MSDSPQEPLRIERDELFTAAVDSALARERAGRERILAEAPPVSKLRRVLLHSMFYLPVAAVLGALATWMLIEPSMHDLPMVGGEVTLINSEPFEGADGIVAITVGERDVLVSPSRLVFEAGAQGQPALQSFDEVAVGSKLEVMVLSIDDGRMLAVAMRPTAEGAPHGDSEDPTWPSVLMLPLTALAIALGLLLAEGLSTRNWMRMIWRTALGGFFATLFAFLAYLPAGLVLRIASSVIDSASLQHPDAVLITVHDLSPTQFLITTVCRSVAWAILGAGLGLGMNLMRSTRAQLRNSVIGGILGGALGGMFFDPIDRFFRTSLFDDADASRFVGLLAVGLSVGVFVALVERLGRDAWVRVRTGPLAGKSFILYKTPTTLGNAPSSDIYLYKDSGIDPHHARIHRVGTTYEIEDQSSRTGTSVGGQPVRRRRLASGDQIILGSTILDFEERARRS